MNDTSIIHSVRWNTGHEYGPIDEADTMGRIIRADSRIVLDAAAEPIDLYEEQGIKFRVRFVDETRQIAGEVTIWGYENMSESEFKRKTLQAYIAGGYDWLKGNTHDVGPYDKNNFNPWRI